MNVTDLGSGLSFANARAEVSANNETIDLVLDVVVVTTTGGPTTGAPNPSPTTAAPQNADTDPSNNKNKNKGNTIGSLVIPIVAVAAGVIVLLAGCCYVGRQRRANAQGPNKYTAEMALGMTPAYSASETLGAADMAGAAPARRSRSGSRRRQSVGSSAGVSPYGNTSVAASPTINYETLPPTNPAQPASIQYSSLA